MGEVKARNLHQPHSADAETQLHVSVNIPV